LLASAICLSARNAYSGEYKLTEDYALSEYVFVEYGFDEYKLEDDADFITNGLLAYWKMDEGTGQELGDSGEEDNPLMLGSTTGADTNDPSWTDGVPALTMLNYGLNYKKFKLKGGWS